MSFNDETHDNEEDLEDIAGKIKKEQMEIEDDPHQPLKNYKPKNWKDLDLDKLSADEWFHLPSVKDAWNAGPKNSINLRKKLEYRIDVNISRKML